MKRTCIVYKLIICIISICISIFIPLSQMAKSRRLMNQLSYNVETVKTLTEEKCVAEFELNKMQTTENLIALGIVDNLNLKSINSLTGMLASN